MIKKLSKKIVLTVIAVFMISGCSKHKEIVDDVSQVIRIFDSSDNLIAELEDIDAIPDQYQDYIAQVMKQVLSKTRVTSYGGFDIYTNLDTSVQDILDRSVNSELAAAILVSNNKTGEIIAVHNSTYTVDRSDRYSESEEKSILEEKFSHSPILSPIFAYPLAFEYLSTSTADYILDSPFQYGETGLTAQNSDGQHLGPITLQQSLNQSRVANLWLADAVIAAIGLDTVEEYLSGFIADTDAIENVNVQYALGAWMTTLTDVSGGYQMILNGGEYHEASYINKIINRADNELNLSFRTTNPLSEEASYLTTQLLKDSFTGLAFFDFIEDQQRDYQLYGFASNTSYEIENNSQENIQLFAAILGNADYSISSFVRYAGDIEENSVASNIRTTYSNILDQLESSTVLTQSISKPAGIMDTNYLPGSLKQDGMDAHAVNDTSIPNPGYSK